MSNKQIAALQYIAANPGCTTMVGLPRADVLQRPVGGGVVTADDRIRSARRSCWPPWLTWARLGRPYHLGCALSALDMFDRVPRRCTTLGRYL